MTQILIDGIANITLHNGILRIECTAAGADGQPHPSGTLVIPGRHCGAGGSGAGQKHAGTRQEAARTGGAGGGGDSAKKSN